MFKITLSCIILLQIKVEKCEEDSFSAVTAMEKLLATQAHLIRAIKHSAQFVNKKEKCVVTAYLARLKKEDALSREDPEHYLGNPINAYTLITRLSRDLQLVESILKKTNTYRRNAPLVYPSATDVEGANTGIIDMQIMYDLDIQQLADGILVTHFSKNKQRFEEFVSPLTASDCFDLARLYFIEKDRIPHVTWLEQAHKRYKTDRHFCNFTEDLLLKNIALNYGFMDDYTHAIYWLEKYLTVKTDDSETKRILEVVKYQYKYSYSKLKPRVSLEEVFGIDLNVKKLCRDDSGHIAGNVSLSCYYARGPHPLLLLAPLRAEFLHRDPDITMFYDVISDAEIEVFKAHVKPKLRRARVMHDETPTASLSRTSQLADVSYDLPAAVRVLRRIQQFTGLRWSRSTADKMVVCNYGLAGCFTPHCDYLGTKNPWRYTTTLLYLSNVEQGGATVFLSANLTVFPVKNAAVFWYNLDAWGNGDPRTIHAACPVIRGSKWVANKWIHLIEQDLSRRCPMYYMEPRDDPACS